MSDITVTPDDKILVRSLPNPFTAQKVDYAFIEGMTVQQILETVEIPDYVSLLVTIGGVPVLPEDYATVIPASGQMVSIRAVPTGGGDGGKNIFRTILTIVVVVVAAVATAYVGGAGGWAAAAGLSGWGISAAAAVAGMAVMTVGMLIVNAIAPPTVASLGSLGGVGSLGGAFSGGSVGGGSSSSGASKPGYALSGASNPLVPYGPIPILLGKHRISPPYGARPYTTNEGDEQYFSCLFCSGYGPLLIYDNRLGETECEKFDEVSLDIWCDTDLIKVAHKIFSNDVFQQDESIVLKQVDGWAQRDTQPNTFRISVDVTYPNGLIKMNDDGSTSKLTSLIDIEYRLKGTTEWKGMTHTISA